MRVAVPGSDHGAHKMARFRPWLQKQSPRLSRLGMYRAHQLSTHPTPPRDALVAAGLLVHDTSTNAPRAHSPSPAPTHVAPFALSPHVAVFLAITALRTRLSIRPSQDVVGYASALHAGALLDCCRYRPRAAAWNRCCRKKQTTTYRAREWLVETTTARPVDKVSLPSHGPRAPGSYTAPPPRTRSRPCHAPAWPEHCSPGHCQRTLQATQQATRQSYPFRPADTACTKLARQPMSFYDRLSTRWPFFHHVRCAIVLHYSSASIVVFVSMSITNPISSLIFLLLRTPMPSHTHTHARTHAHTHARLYPGAHGAGTTPATALVPASAPVKAPRYHPWHPPREPTSYGTAPNEPITARLHQADPPPKKKKKTNRAEHTTAHSPSCASP